MRAQGEEEQRSQRHFVSRARERQHQTNEIKVRVPRSGILRNLYVQQRVASGAAGRTDIYTVRVNGADRAITCTLDNATSGEDTTHAVVVAQGDAADASEDVSVVIVLV